MKKYIVLILTLLLTGCSIVRIDTDSLDNIIDVVLSKDSTLYNSDGQGYKYYIPCGVTHIDTDDLTQTLYYNGEHYYLYVDIVSYYYKTNLKHKVNKDAYFYKKIKIKNKSGYVEIVKKDNLYYVDFYYNYAHMEALVTKDNLKNTVLNASYILSNIKYDKNIIKTMLDDEYLKNRTGKYDLFTTDSDQETFVLEKD